MCVSIGAVCSICHKWFSAQSTLLKHTIWHHKGCVPKLKHNCHKCPYASNEITNFKRHALVHDESRPYGCKVCGNRFKALSSLNTHFIIHCGENPHILV